MSQILTIYQTLAAQAVTADGVTPTAYGLAALPNTVVSAMLPCRLLTPMQPRGEARDYSFVALGTTTKITWHITDLLLWRGAASGIGLEDIASTLVSYAAAYAEMLRTKRSMGTTQAHLTGARFVYGTFEWPEGSGRWYDGVSCELDMEEILSG